MIHHCNRQAFIILVLFTVPFYHFLFSRYLGLTKRHFSLDILVPFPDSSDLYSHECTYLALLCAGHRKVGLSALVVKQLELEQSPSSPHPSTPIPSLVAAITVGITVHSYALLEQLWLASQLVWVHQVIFSQLLGQTNQLDIFSLYQEYNY